MLFNSLQFMIFFPLVVAFYFLIPHRFRWVLLLAASYYFYMCWKAEYIILIIASTLIDYFAGLMMSRAGSRAVRRRYLILSLCSNLGLLFLFKYFNFFNGALSALFRQFNILYGVRGFNLLLPVGISFYTFQTLSYTIDVYRGDREPERHMGIFALYVAFFPQLVAGPIERSTRLLPQFIQEHRFDAERVAGGLRLMLWGYFKKIVIADRLAVVVDHVYGAPADFQGIHFIIATVFFAFQIFCDFSAYSDIAIGTARVLGFKLMTNFNRPYYAKTISEFWKRWHISLSTWFRDYLYIPLGGNRVTKWRWYRNLLVTFVVSGLWHGANWTFIVWGALHGMYLVGSLLTQRLRRNIVSVLTIDRHPLFHRFLKIAITFSLVNFAWIFFRANTLSDAFYIIGHLFSGTGEFASGLFSLDLTVLKNINVDLDIPKFEFFLAFASLAVMETVHMLQRTNDLGGVLMRRPRLMRWAICYFFIIFILLFGKFGSKEFIYFQF